MKCPTQERPRVVGVEKLEGGGQIVVHEFPDLGQLGGLFHHRVDDLAGGALQLGDLRRDFKGKIEDMMDTICTAFDKQLDALYGEEALDISTDITVLENIARSRSAIRASISGLPVPAGFFSSFFSGAAWAFPVSGIS